VTARNNQIIRQCRSDEFGLIGEIINDAARAYRGVIPEDRWHEPYISSAELAEQANSSVVFWGMEQNGILTGVMGIQPVQDVTLIRHAYVRTACRNRGIGSSLLRHLRTLTTRPILIGTWAAAVWAVAFYEKHGFGKVTPAEKDRLLKKYWSIPDRQIETSVVLADERWFEADRAKAR
jgi:N-acetylglutamate synthase-like GNAT family acetyltransferase